jgi:hypothetical protein
MSTQPAIACTLAELEMPARRAQMAVLGRDLVGAEVQGAHAVLRFGPAAGTREAAHAVLRFRPAAGTRERLAAFVAAESRCCAFLRMQLRDDADALVLTIDGPAGSEPVVGELVAAFTAAQGA